MIKATNLLTQRHKKYNEQNFSNQAKNLAKGVLIDTDRKLRQ